MPKFFTLFFSITPPKPIEHFQEPKKHKISRFIMFFFIGFHDETKAVPAKASKACSKPC